MQFGKSSGKAKLVVHGAGENKPHDNVHGLVNLETEYVYGGFTISITELITFMTTRWDLFVKLVKGTFKAMPLIRTEIWAWYKIYKELRIDDVIFERTYDDFRKDYPSYHYPERHQPEAPKPSTEKDSKATNSKATDSKAKA